MSLSPDALKESKIKAINSFKSNGKPPSIKASHLQQKWEHLYQMFMEKNTAGKICFYMEVSSCSRGGQFRLEELEMIFS